MLKICRQQFLLALTSPRTYIALVIGIIIQLISLTQFFDFSQIAGKPLCIFEGFVFFNCDTFTTSATFLGVLFLISDIPFTSENETYTLIRVNRAKWVLGKTLYLFAACIIFYSVVAVAGMIYISSNAYIANFWSDAVGYLTKDTNMSITAQYNVYFLYPFIINSLTPASAFFSSMTLSVLYAFMMSLFVFCLNLRLSYVVSFVIAAMLHVAGYLIATILKSPFYMRFSLLGNSLLRNHNIKNYYSDSLLLSVGQSVCLFLGISLILVVVILRGVRRYDFKISIGTKA